MKLIPLTEREITRLIELSVDGRRLPLTYGRPRGAALQVTPDCGWAIAYLMTWRLQNLEIFIERSVIRG